MCPTSCLPITSWPAMLRATDGLHGPGDLGHVARNAAKHFAVELLEDLWATLLPPHVRGGDLAAVLQRQDFRKIRDTGLPSPRRNSPRWARLRCRSDRAAACGSRAAPSCSDGPRQSSSSLAPATIPVARAARHRRLRYRAGLKQQSARTWSFASNPPVTRKWYTNTHL